MGEEVPLLQHLQCLIDKQRYTSAYKVPASLIALRIWNSGFYEKFSRDFRSHRAMMISGKRYWVDSALYTEYRDYYISKWYFPLPTVSAFRVMQEDYEKTMHYEVRTCLSAMMDGKILSCWDMMIKYIKEEGGIITRKIINSYDYFWYTLDYQPAMSLEEWFDIPWRGMSE